jgi:hypothetical protein
VNHFSARHFNEEHTCGHAQDYIAGGAKLMKTMFFATAAVLSIGIGSAYAEGGQVRIPNTKLPELQAQELAYNSAAGAGLVRSATQSRPDPTGQTWYGPHGEISLWAPNPNW